MASFKGATLNGLMGHAINYKGAVPQSQPLDERQVANNAGGFTFQIDDTARLRRFLIIGSEGGTYYVTEEKLTLEAARGVKALLDAGKGLEVVAEVVKVSTEGRAPKQSPGVFALALCCRLGDAATKTAAYAAVPQVCRTASTLYDFVNYAKLINQEVAESEKRKVGNASWGRGMRHAVGGWFVTKPPMQLAYQVTKYGQRGGWCARDLLRLAHPQAEFIRVQAARRQAEQAAGELAKATLDDDDSDEWQVVGGDGGGDGASERSAAAPVDAKAALDKRVEEMQQVLRFVVEEEARPAGDGDGRVAQYLAAAHRLRKAQAAMPEPPKAESDAAEPMSASEPAHEAAAQAGGKPAEGADVQPAAAQPAAGPPAAAAAPGASAASAPADGQASAAAAPPAGGGKREAADGQAAAQTDAAQPASKRCKVEKVKQPVKPVTPEEVCALIRRHRFSREHIGDTRLLKSLEVWSTLLDVGMPFTALTRNLARLTSLGAFDPARCSRAAEHLAAVTKRFQDPESMKAARAHPIVLLNALRVYASGHGDRGSLQWEPHLEVSAALDAGFYHAFRNVRPTGRRFLLGVDVSGSMDYYKCAGMAALTPRDAAAAVAMALLRTEGADRVATCAFTTTFSPLDLRPGDTLEQALRITGNQDFGSTDCAQPMVYALEKGLKVDCFVVLTDSETWAGGVHPAEALRQYRAKTGIPARLLVLAFAGNAHTVADPDDAGMLDVPGLDAGVPEVMRQFVLGEL